jgi:hypothetical protein
MKWRLYIKYKESMELTIRRKEKTHINNIRDHKVDITTNTNEIQRAMREYFENFNLSKPGNLEKWINF